MPVLDSPRILGRSNGLDVFRAVLALWVFLGHLFRWVPWIEGPQSAPHFMQPLALIVLVFSQTRAELPPSVLCFIVLSGYCIHRVGLRRDDADFRDYAIRRVVRILPLFFIAFAAGIASGAFMTARPSLGCIAAHVTLLSTLTSEFESCHLGNDLLETLQVEIVLYALYALVVWLMLRRLREWTLWATCAAVAALNVAVAALAHWNFDFYCWWQNGSLLGFFCYWWIGAAFVSPSIVRRASAACPYLIGIYLALTAAILALTPSLLQWSYSPNDVPVAVFILAEIRKLVLAVLAGILIVRLETVRVAAWNPIAAMGRASYSLYALHTPVTFFLCVAAWPWYLIAVANIVVALASHFIVERRGSGSARTKAPCASDAAADPFRTMSEAIAQYPDGDVDFCNRCSRGDLIFERRGTVMRTIITATE